MLGTLLGLPLATFVGERFGWRSAFWTISLITVAAAALTLGGVRNPAAASGTRSRAGTGSDLAVLRRPQFLLALASSTFIIGATFSVFSFFTPILTEVTGFSEGVVPVLLLVYGTATLVGNIVVGRLADRRTISTLLLGTGLNVLFLTGFALFTDVPPLALAFMVGIGLVGVTMNPAMAVRVQRAGSSSPLVNTVHGSFITLGVMIGSAVGSALVPQHGLRAPIVLGVGLAVLAFLAMVPHETSRAGRGQNTWPSGRNSATSPSPAVMRGQSAPGASWGFSSPRRSNRAVCAAGPGARRAPGPAACSAARR
ncbi:MFS transporter [Streptomyces sp. MMCC 100]|uniref:MFS transporter n=1 Tax=Streptomyces sp. MMCC 100 TaxID=3163555 RepID=UPI003596A1CE